MLLTVALAQIDIHFGLPDDNLAAIRPLVAAAAARGADLIVLPELWSTGYNLTRASILADAPESGIHAHLAHLAREQGIAIAGSTLTRCGAQPTNTATLYGADGSLLASYDKLHLFGPMHEDTYLAAGSDPVSVAAPWGRTALALCYDLRFPELFRFYALQGTKIVLVPAEWPAVRLEHWRTLVQARAIENQYFVIAVNRVGSDPDHTFGGHSLVVDPTGQVLVEGDTNAGLLFARLDLTAIEASRALFHVLHDRRLDAY